MSSLFIHAMSRCDFFLFKVGLTIIQGKELKDTFNCRGRVALGSATNAMEETCMAKVNQGCLTRPKCH
jgi:hypothetical protein